MGRSLREPLVCGEKSMEVGFAGMYEYRDGSRSGVMISVEKKDNKTEEENKPDAMPYKPPQVTENSSSGTGVRCGPFPE